jgi:hypothetical protein
MVQTATFASDMILFLRDYLRDNITDPLGRTKGFVMTSYPKRDVQYPIITCKITNINSQKLGISSETSLINMDMEVRAWTKESKQAETLTQDIINTLRTAQFGTGGTSEDQMFGFRLNNVNSIVESEGDNSIHSKILSFNYKTILE